MVNLASTVKMVTRVMVSPGRNVLREAIVTMVSQNHALLVRMVSPKETRMKPPLAKIAKPGITNPVVVKQRVWHAAKVGIPAAPNKNPRVLA